jgi:hypothetical protein
VCLGKGDHDHHAHQGMAQQGGGEVRQPIAVQGRRDTRTAASPLAGGAGRFHAARGRAARGGRIGCVNVGARAREPTVAGLPRRPGPGGLTGRARGVARRRHAAELWSAKGSHPNSA